MKNIRLRWQGAETPVIIMLSGDVSGPLVPLCSLDTLQRCRRPAAAALQTLQPDCRSILPLGGQMGADNTVRHPPQLIQRSSSYQLGPPEQIKSKTNVDRWKNSIIEHELILFLGSEVEWRCNLQSTYLCLCTIALN